MRTWERQYLDDVTELGFWFVVVAISLAVILAALMQWLGGPPLPSAVPPVDITGALAVRQ